MQSEFEDERAILVSRNERYEREIEELRAATKGGLDGSRGLGDSGCFVDAIEEIARRVVNEKDLHIGVEDLPPQMSRRSRSPSPMRSRGASPERRVDLKPGLA